MNHQLRCVRVLIIWAALGGAAAPWASAQSATTSETDRLSIFGIGTDAQNTHDLTKWIPQYSAIGVHSTRYVGGIGWDGKLPYNFNDLDHKLTYAEANKMSSGAMLYNYRPKPKNGLPMDDLQGWSAYVSAAVAHTQGRMKYFEVWNEPPNGLAKGQTAADYAKFVVATYDAVKKANPNAQVGLAAKSAAISYLDQTIRAGAKGHFDYITLHPYETLGSAIKVPSADPMFMSIVPNVRKMLAATDPAKKDAPVWLTEIGFDAKKSEDRQARALLMTYTMGIAQGMAVIDWFACRDGDSGPMGLIHADDSPRPGFNAYTTMIKHFGQFPTYLGWVLLNDRDYGFLFQGANGPILSTWAPVSTTDKYDFGAEVDLIDPFTDKVSKSSTADLTDMPIFVESVPAKLVDLAKSNKAKPLPWGGDYTNAKSVSVTMGEKNIEKGLHTHSGDTIAADVILYGGNARAGTVPGGNVFIVDPNFLSYDTVPIEISVVCRRDEKNTPFSLKVEYESTSGYKKTSAFDIPDNKEWHTATWKITDAQFVSMWGFNFRMDAGKYAVQSVTVTKIGK